MTSGIRIDRGGGSVVTLTGEVRTLRMLFSRVDIGSGSSVELSHPDIEPGKVEVEVSPRDGDISRSQVWGTLLMVPFIEVTSNNKVFIDCSIIPFPTRAIVYRLG